MELKTEFKAGLEFVVPTWDPTPVSWNPRGSWFRDEAVEARVLAGVEQYFIDQGISVLELTQDAQSFTDRYTIDDHGDCNTYWGSHGCFRPKGHVGLCVCLECSAIYKLNESVNEFGHVSGDCVLWWYGDDGFGTFSYHGWCWFN